MSLGERIKELRKKKGLTQKAIADQLGMGSSNFGHIENNRVVPSSNDLDKLAEILGTTTDYLLGREQKREYYSLTEKDERDIAKDLERILDDLESDQALAFHGEPMDDETKRLFIISLENSLRFAKEKAKQKFTPKKYRD